MELCYAHRLLLDFGKVARDAPTMEYKRQEKLGGDLFVLNNELK